MRLWLALLCAAALASSSAEAARFALLRPKQASPQFDEAIAGLRGEIGEVVFDVVVDDGVVVDDVRARVRAEGVAVVIAVGARAAQVAAQLELPSVACMLLQSAAAPSTPRLVKVPLGVPARTQIDTLRALVPTAKRVGVLYDPRFNAAEVAELKAAGEAARVQVVGRTVDDQRATPAAFDALVGDVDGLILLADATVVSKSFIQFLLARSFEKRLPVLGYSESFVRLGLLAALVPSPADNGRIAARIARRLVEGVAPSELAGAAAMRGALVVNKAAAAKMGFVLPPRMLAAPTVVVGEP